MKPACVNWSSRVAETIRDWGMNDGYFRSTEDAATFHDELVYLLIRQYAAFNSPVWFNVGCERVEPKSDATNWHWNLGHRSKSNSAPPDTPVRSAPPASSIR